MKYLDLLAARFGGTVTGGDGEQSSCDRATSAQTTTYRGRIDIDLPTAQLLGRACIWAADNAEGDADLMARYPLFCFEVLKNDKTWKQLENEASQHYLRSLLRPERMSYRDELIAADRLIKSRNAAKRDAGEAQWLALAKRKYDHYARVLYCELTGKDPKTHVWNDLDIGLATPDNLPEAALQRLFKAFDDAQQIKQVQ